MEKETNLLNDNLMLQIANGSTKAFDILCGSTYKVLYNYIYSIVKNSTVTEDLLHDTYLCIQKSISTYKPQNKPMAWIFTIARNRAYSYFQKQKNDVSIEEYSNLAMDSYENSCIENLVLSKAMHILNEKERTVILLNAVSGYKFREISKYTGIPFGTVLSSYSRGIKKLQKEMEKQEVIIP